MCGIVGYLNKSGAPAAVGERLFAMLTALARRGPDSSGVAIWGPASRGLIVRVKTAGPGETGAGAGVEVRAERRRREPDARRGPSQTARVPAPDDIARRFERVRARAGAGALVRFEIATAGPTTFELSGAGRGASRSRKSRRADEFENARSICASPTRGEARIGQDLARAIEAIRPGVEVVSMGRRLEIVKQVGAPHNLETEFGVSKLIGTHALGHTRLSTESRVDLSHSQPFWAHGTPDLAVVHNGHITNYHRLRRMYEQDGVRFYTENDSEIIGIYVARKLGEGASLEEALAASVRELDGSFSYLVATADAFGFAKDPFCLKPLIVGENADAIAIANEEVALQAALRGPYTAREAGAGAVAVWKVSPQAASRGRPASAPRKQAATRPRRAE